MGMRCSSEPHAALSAPRAFAAGREKPSPPCFSSGKIFLGLEFCTRFPVSEIVQAVSTTIDPFGLTVSVLVQAM